MIVSPQPISQQSYRNAPFPFVFTFKDGEDPMDLSVFTNIQVKYFTLVNQESPEILLESGDGLTVDSNTVSGELTAEQTLSLYNKVIYFEWIFWTNDDKMIPVNGRHIVSNVPEGAKGSDATISIVDNQVTVESVGIISIAQAIIARDAAEAARDQTTAAADQALIDIGNAKDSAITDINAARDAGLQAISDAESSGVQAVNDAKDSAITEINGLVQQAQAARDKANEWAQNPEDDPVETGQFSALHWSAKSEAHAGDAETAKTGAETAQAGAQTARTGSETARNKSQEWAENPEDDPVEAGQFSALHWSAKSEGYAGDAQVQAELAEAEANKVINALVQLGLVNQAHRDYTFAIIAQGGEINDPISTKELFES